MLKSEAVGLGAEADVVKVKRGYARFIDALDAAAKDVLPQMKSAAVKSLASLLTSKPENEQRILSIIVNKLGDPDRHAASQASFLLSGVLGVHPAMKRVVCDAVASLCFRPNVGHRALYYSLLFLQSMTFTHRADDAQLAGRMMQLYFTLLGRLFGDVVAGKAGAGDASAEAAGAAAVKKKTPKGSKKGKHGHANNKGKKAAARAAADAAAEASALSVDSRLLGALLTGIRRAFPYVEASRSDALIEGHLPRLFKLAHVSSLKAAVQIAAVVHQLLDARRSTSNRFHRLVYELLSRAGDAASHAGGEHRGVVNRLLSIALALCRDDVSHARVCAFARRMLQMAGRAKPPTACGMLLVVSEMCAAKPKLRNLIVASAAEARAGGDDELEMYVDADTDGTPLVALDAPGLARADAGGGDVDDDLADDRAATPTSYDPRAREPQYSGADLEAMWELGALTAHVHPSVRAMAVQLAETGHVVYDGDPTADLTLMAFLHNVHPSAQ